MTLTILMSFSVLALVVTARPILPDDTPQPEPPTPSIHDVVQAIFQSRTRTSPDCLSCNEEHDIHLKLLTSPEEQHAVLSSLDEIDAVKAITPIGLDGILSEDEKKLYNIISTSSSGGLDDLDGGERMPEEFSLLFKPDADEQVDNTEVTDASFVEASTNIFTSPPLIVLGLSCIAAFLAMGCIAVALYTTSVIRKRVLGSSVAWELLPRLERYEPLDQESGDGVQGPSNDGDSARTFTEKRTLPAPARPELVVEVINEKVDLIILETESSEDELYDEKDEKFHDANSSMSKNVRCLHWTSAQIYSLKSSLT
ncbi:hypothetical protein QCA50_018967 [Cerrena zonata]|uniref:Uncharacterized protein n=1 Tax=Cerrena zonata TaxID=2478898 RepID=A0AAW0FLC8_9APHY